MDLKQYLKMMNGNQLKQVLQPQINILKQEQQRFKNILLRHMQKTRSYKPKVYDRGNHGGSFMNSIDIDDNFQIDLIDGKIKCNILVNDNTWHDSVIDNSKGNSLYLLNSGWSWDDPSKGAYFFSYFEGYHFIEDAVKEFESTSKYGVKVEVIYPNEYYRY